MSGREALFGTSLTLTGEPDAAGGTSAVWGRRSQARFDGREGDLTLDGEVTSGLLGMDYARERWLARIALSQSDAEGGYSGSDNGKIGVTLTAKTVYGSLRARERLKLWGALVHGASELMLTPENRDAMETDLSSTMTTAGARDDLLTGAGSALASISDALWARTTSDRVAALEAADADVTRFRLSLERSWAGALEHGGSVIPKLTLGVRHDDGDAETGFGVEFGGGLVWTATAPGFDGDIKGRTLFTHEADWLKDRGYAASVVLDPAPESAREPSLKVLQDWGEQTGGGLDALFAPDPLQNRAGVDATSLWTVEGAWSFPAIGERFTGCPHLVFVLSTGFRDGTLGWRHAPGVNANVPMSGPTSRRRAGRGLGETRAHARGQAQPARVRPARC